VEENSVAVLVVDDEEPIRNALRRFLAGRQFEVHTAGSGNDALAVLREHEISLMLSDIRMPGMSGVDLVPQALEVAPNLAVVMLSAINDATTAALCMQRGAMDYLTKPLELDDLERAVQRALRRRASSIEDRQLDVQLKEELATRAAEWQRERAETQRVTVATLEALVNAMEARDPYLRGHSSRVADLSATIAAHLGLSDDDVETVRLTGRLHDIGKIGTREAVMNKQGPLTPDEYDHVKQHVMIGSQILAPLGHLAPVLSGVRSHHERWDGAGYPDGLRGEDIPMAARIIGAAEVYDALCTSRPYQDKMTPTQAVRRLGELVGTVLDPKVFTSLAEVVTRRRSLVFLEDSGPPDP
jgi:putative nucleotidyltransferase with HDIG domain